MVDHAGISSKVELFISCKDLPSKDVLSKSDPFAVLSIKDVATGRLNELGRTETIKNNENPTFKKQFLMDYHFEEIQELTISIYDSDSSSADLSRHDYIGGIAFNLGNLVAAAGQSITQPLIKKDGSRRSNATCTVKCEEISGEQGTIHFSIAGEKLDKKDLFGKSDPFLQFFRIREDNTWVQVHQTEWIANTLNPRWQPFAISLTKLCNGDVKRPLLIKCFDYDKNSAPDFIGEFQSSLAEIVESKEKRFVLRKPNHPKPEKRQKPHGTIIFNKAELVKEFSFLDYIRGGMQVGMMVAVDFTGSNGDPAHPNSLHYRGGGVMNAYQQAIGTIGDIVLQYDSDKNVPVWGFGGKVNGRVDHCFPLTFNPNQIEVHGVQGILGAYNNAFNHVLLSGPTYFSEILRTVTSIAAQPYSPGLQHYSILLIITDGVINDMKETIAAIVDASDKPLSIIIVGVGDANFSQMDALDGDEKQLVSNGKKAARDMVQFVPLNKFKNEHISKLAAETLAEVPNQLLSFMKLHKIAPLPPRPVAPVMMMVPPQPQGVVMAPSAVVVAPPIYVQQPMSPPPPY